MFSISLNLKNSILVS